MSLSNCTLYSWYRIPMDDATDTSARTFRMFNCAVGKPGNGYTEPLTQFQTNMRKPNRLGYAVKVHRVSWHVPLGIQRYSLFFWEFLQTPRHDQRPLVATTIEYKEPVELPAHCQFDVGLVTEFRSPYDIDILCVLEGTYNRD